MENKDLDKIGKKLETIHKALEQIEAMKCFPGLTEGVRGGLMQAKREIEAVASELMWG